MLFLFGAGASVCSGASPRNPPLGKDLFAELTAAGYVPPDLPADVLKLFQTSPKFELGMEALARGHYGSFAYNSLLRSMGRYFAKFLPTADSHYTKLFRALKNPRLAAATLNYENLIEHSLTELGLRAHKVIKPHGSCSFLPNLGSMVLQDIAIFDVGEDKADIELPVDIVLDPALIESWCVDPAHDCLAPAMSFYATAKPTRMCRNYVQSHRDAWKMAVSQCHLCFVVGVACNPRDAHIWEPLATADCNLVHVNIDDVEFQPWLEATRRKRATHWRKPFGEAIPDIVAWAS